MKIVFIGTVSFSYKMLEKIIKLNGEIVGVCTKEISSFNSDFEDLTPLCKKNNIPYTFIEDINSKENIEWIKELNPDVIFCFGWSTLIKEELLNFTKLGVIGYHPAKLPLNRGRHPIIWSLALGLKQTASTFFFMDKGADSGDILSQKDITIEYEDNAQTLYKKLIDISIKQIEDFLPKLQNNTYTKIKQNHELANSWRKRGEKDGIIDFRMSSLSVYNLVRALTKPYPGAHIKYKGKDIQIWKVKEIVCNLENIEMGKVIEKNSNSIIVKCQKNAVEILEHEFKELPNVGEYL